MKTMIAKYPGTCAACQKPIKRGETINFFGRGIAEHAHHRAELAPARKDNSSGEDARCGDLAYEDQCAAACGM